MMLRHLKLAGFADRLEASVLKVRHGTEMCVCVSLCWGRCILLAALHFECGGGGEKALPLCLSGSTSVVPMVKI